MMSSTCTDTKTPVTLTLRRAPRAPKGVKSPFINQDQIIESQLALAERLKHIDGKVDAAAAEAKQATATAKHALQETRKLAGETDKNTTDIAHLLQRQEQMEAGLAEQKAELAEQKAELAEQKKLLEQVTELRDMLDGLQTQSAPTDLDEHKKELQLLTTQVSDLQKQLIMTNSIVKGTRAMATSNHTGGQLSRNLQQQQITELREKFERLENAKKIEATRKATQAAFLNGNFKPCRFGVSCRDSNCTFGHPAGRPSPCTYGSKCYNHKCKNLHPKDRQLLCPSIHKGVECTRGPTCRFSHTAADGEPAAEAHPADVHQH